MSRPNYTKNTGDTYTAAEWSQIQSKCNAPALNDAWSSVVKFDDEYYPPAQTISTNTTYTIDATNANTGNGRVDYITASGTPTLTFTGFTIRKSDLTVSTDTVTLEDGKSYIVAFIRRGAVSEVYLTATEASTAPAVPPLVTSIVILDTALDEVLINFDQNVNATSLAGFTLSGTTETTMTLASGSGTSQLVGTLATPATLLETILCSYNSALGNVVASDDSVALESFTDTSVTVGDTTAPQIVLITIGDIADNVVNFQYDETLATGFVPQTTDIVVKYDDVAQTVSSVAISGQDCRATIAASATSNTVVKASYTQSAGNEIQDDQGNKAANIAEQVITNLLDLGLMFHQMDEANLTLDGSDFVDLISDTSGNNIDGDHAVANFNATNKPFIQRADVNGKDTILFTTANYQIDQQSFNGKNGFTVLAAVKVTNLTNGTIISNYADTAGTSTGFDEDNTGGGFKMSISDFDIKEHFKSIGGNYSAAVTITIDQWEIVVFRFVPKLQLSAWVDNVRTEATEVPSGLVTKLNTGPSMVGAHHNVAVGTNLAGSMRSINIFDRPIGNTELATKINVLAADIGTTVDTSALTESIPVIQSAVIGRQADNVIRLYYNKILNYQETGVSTGSYSLSGTTATVSSLEIGAAWVDLTLDSTPNATDTITVSYTAGTPKVQSNDGNHDVANLVSYSVSNHIFDVAGATFLVDARKSASYTLDVNQLDCTIKEITNNLAFDTIGTTQARRQPHADDDTPSFQNCTTGTEVLPDVWSANGMTIYIVCIIANATAGNGIACSFKSSDTPSIKWRIANNSFQLWNSDASTAGQVTYTTAPTLNKKLVLAFRWTSATELSSYIDGEWTQSTATIPDYANVNTAPSDFCFDTKDARFPGASVADTNMYFMAGFDTAHSQAVVKANIEKLTDAFEVPGVDTSSIV